MTLVSIPCVWMEGLLGLPLVSDLVVLGHDADRMSARFLARLAWVVGAASLLTGALLAAMPLLGFALAAVTFGGIVGLSVGWTFLLLGLQDPIRDVLRERKVLR